MALEEALDVTRRRRRRPARRRAGPHRLRRAAAVPGGRVPRTLTSSCTSSRGRSSRTRASTIGVVEGVQGISWTEVTITGRSAHAGTTPMRMRRDPGYVAARDRHRRSRDLAGRARRGAGGHRRPRSTLSPTSSTSCPHGVTITVDLRNTDEPRCEEAEQRAGRRARAAGGGRGVTVDDPLAGPLRAGRRSTRRRSTSSSATAHALGYSTRRMPSGAGHDAQMLARVCPTAMIFVPSRRTG